MCKSVGVVLTLLLAVRSVLAGPPDNFVTVEPPPPPTLAAFLHDHATGKAPWHVTVHELGDMGAGFVGHAVKNTGELDRSVADELLSQLALGRSFDTSAYKGHGVRCIGSRLGLRLARDGATLDLVFDCGQLQIGPRGEPIGVSPTMYATMTKVEAWALPCAPMVIPELDVEICMPRSAEFGGGPIMSRQINAPLSACRQLSVGTAPPRDPKYLRKVGTFELSCNHDDTPACIKACDSMRPLPHSTATEPFPAGQPVIDAERTWPGQWGVQIWSDGAVLFAGPKCPKVRSQRAQITADQLATLIADIKATGFLTAKDPGNGRKYDAENFRLRVTAGGQTNDIHLFNGAKLPEVTATRALITKVVGTNPCE